MKREMGVDKVRSQQLLLEAESKMREALEKEKTAKDLEERKVK